MNTYIQRDMEPHLIQLAQQYPVITLTGPRQSGKTTLIQKTFPNLPYVNLESIQARRLAQADPVGFLDPYPNGAILDEIQNVPELLSEVQVRVDNKQQPGMYILSGSHQGRLRASIAQSLAGRTAVLHLLPLSLSEMRRANIELDDDSLLLAGSFPRIHQAHLEPNQAYGYYIETYLERDLRQLAMIKQMNLFQKFLILCAGRIGQVLNKEGLANEVGVTAKTVNEWLSLLESSYLIVLLPPYFENFGKRVIKSPKLYFTDVGLAAHLLGIENAAQMSRDPLRGQLFENLAVMELIKTRWNQGLKHRLHFYRDSSQHEIDIIFPIGQKLIPIEIKASKTFNPHFYKGIRHLEKLTPERLAHPSIIYAGREEANINGITLLNIHQSARALPSS